MLRRYHIVAIPIRIVVNSFGDHDPNGLMYVLKENEHKVKTLVAKNPFTPVDLVQPLVVRANEGDEIEILFENQLPFASSIHIQNADYNVLTSDGAFVGFNPDTTAEPGDVIRYQWKVNHEGICYFCDMGNTLSSEAGSHVHGLWGALIVEPRGSWWTDPVTGKPFASGLYADVHNPFLPSFREYAWFFHDEMEVDDLTGDSPIDPHTLQPQATHLINYRSEPMRNRMRLIQEGVVSPDLEGEEVHHDSWVFGDPATPILKAYVGDPIKIRVINGALQETHVFHYHLHQWLFEQSDLDSEIVDSQAISPQTFFTISPAYGAGSLQGAFGDVVIHCHLYPHFEEGMWGLNRIFNTLQDGSQCYPNGTPIQALQPLPGRPVPPRPTREKPGFPNFVPGIPGCKAPRPPLGIKGGRESTQLEINQFAPNAVPGAVFANPCTPGVTPERHFKIALIQTKIVYNKEGWHDPQGRIFVLMEDVEDILQGRKNPEPLVIRANAGECVRFEFTNLLPEVLGGNAFQLVNRTYEASMHVHFVKFDPLVSDGSNVGWNYDSSVLPGETIYYQWFSDVELKSTFWHDHLFANTHQMHGVFAGINIEPRGSRHLSPRTGEEIRSGTQAMIVNPFLPDYREFTLFVHDFALLFDKDGCPLNPADFPGSHEDPGVMGVNYRCEPIQFRLNKREYDPAYVFSSWLHGDPVTPLLETYNGDPVRLRLLDGAHEESHSFNLHRQRWKRERPDVDSDLVQQQHIAISESYTLEFSVEGEGDFDMLYHYGSLDDIWLGNWGIMRTFGERVEHLMPLPDRPAPPERTKPLPKPTCQAPPKAKPTSMPGPEGAPVRTYEVTAMQASIAYNEYGDHDPHGLIFALNRDVEQIRSGELNPEPLIIRANVGEVVELTLRNEIGIHRHETALHGYPGVPVEVAFPPSERISIHAHLLVYDVRDSDGATVGYNYDQTVGPGECYTYRWYIDEQVGAASLVDMADIRHHRHHGSFGILITEPRNSRYIHPLTGEAEMGGSQVVVVNPFGAFREFAIIMHDGVRLYDKCGNLIIDPESPLLQPFDEAADFEDQGSRGFNYRAERFKNRLADVPNIAKVFSSTVHGDPSTPIFMAHAGDPVAIRFVFPADRARAHSFVLHGHSWLRSDDDVNSQPVSVQGQNTVGTSDDFILLYGAGGYLSVPGDYMYRSGNIRWDIELGLWGIFRVLDREDETILPLPVPYR
ncbi:multicopper oxidase domain-containing protein [Paenibacillus tarimensis]|uniref:multicopper oxidase domain-containing protein n=1 Tax=Paenibacillus tarimensis TaxID=416012 RepID=UPI001F21026A|nr:multicopper oxidase domain-containing protein [Paenibacillus tarimensis]MCF2945553.1 multicopper oxidase domain-containing protein [Paenibacillus tarimensis]